MIATQRFLSSSQGWKSKGDTVLIKTIQKPWRTFLGQTVQATDRNQVVLLSEFDFPDIHQFSVRFYGLPQSLNKVIVFLAKDGVIKLNYRYDQSVSVVINY